MTLTIRESWQLALIASKHVLIISVILYLARKIIHKVSTEKIEINLTAFMSYFFVYLEYEMEEMEEGKENSTEDVNIENVDNIICHEELQSEVINPDIDQSIEDISTIQDSKEVLCHGILLDILEKMFKQPSDPDSEVATYNHQNTNQNDDEIIQKQIPED